MSFSSNDKDKLLGAAKKAYEQRIDELEELVEHQNKQIQKWQQKAFDIKTAYDQLKKEYGILALGVVLKENDVADKQ